MPLTHVDEARGLSLVWRVDVAPERLWQCLTDPSMLRLWLGELVVGSVTPGSEVVIDHGDGYLCRSSVVELAEPSLLDLTWQFPDEPPSRVTVALEEDPAARGSTEIRLSHSGLGDLVGSYRAGWCVHLSYLEAAALGTPLPTSMFWNLHATIAHLAGR